jgi:anti-anti-sigma factor
MPQAPHVPYRLETLGSITVVHFMDHNMVSQVRDQLFTLVEDAGHRQLLLDFSHLKGLTSIAIAQLLMLWKKVTGLQGRLKICCVNVHLLELLGFAGLDRVIEIYETQEEALRTF